MILHVAVLSPVLGTPAAARASCGGLCLFTLFTFLASAVWNAGIFLAHPAGRGSWVWQLIALENLLPIAADLKLPGVRGLELEALPGGQAPGRLGGGLALAG